MKKNISLLLLLIIVIIAAFLRVYKLDQVPPSLYWDEAANGYNAWTIANYGKDEYGNFFPPYFRSFGDDKHPVHIYLTAISEKIFGLNEFGTRFPSALFGVLNVFLIFCLGKLLFKSYTIGIIAALFLAISPYNIHFSRFNHEAVFETFFFMLGLVLFYLSFNKRVYFPLSILSFCITFITYHPAKVVIPIIAALLVSLYFKQIKKDKFFLAAISVVIIFTILLLLNPQLLGLARVNQTIQGSSEIKKTKLYQFTKNELIGRINLIAIQYSWHFTPQYLFIQGDKNPKLSSQTGEFYKIDAFFVILGFLYLIRKRSKESIILLVWALAAPLPAALVAEAPHAARASFMMGSWNLISALGFYSILNIFKGIKYKLILSGITLIVLTFSLASYLNYYYGEYAKRYAIEWQYGIKQIVEYVKVHPEYSEVFMTDVRSQPYIFFLYWLKTPLPVYLDTVAYNNSESKSYNAVSFFDRYFFGSWDPIESFPNEGVLYIVTPSQYDGLRYKSFFDVKKKIVYPNGLDAYFIVSKK